MEIGHVKTRLNCMLSAATSCSSRLHHCPRLARFVLAFKSSLLYSSKPFMNIPSVPGGNGPIFDTRYCRRKILQNLARGIGWLASARVWAPPTPRCHSLFALRFGLELCDTKHKNYRLDLCCDRMSDPQRVPIRVFPFQPNSEHCAINKLDSIRLTQL